MTKAALLVAITCGLSVLFQNSFDAIMWSKKPFALDLSQPARRK